MSVIVAELFLDRTEVVDETLEVHYIIIGAANEAEVTAEAQSQIPATYNDLVLDSIEIIEPVNLATWKVAAYYKRPEYVSTEIPDEVFTFDTGGGSQHITQALSTVAKYPAAAADMKGAIGFDGKSVKGVSIHVPVFTFTETHYKTAAYVTDTYKETLFRATGKVNNATFGMFAACECLFMGVSGRQNGSGGRWELTFKFAGSENVTGKTIGAITGIDKKGWEYLWVRYEDKADADELVQQPKAVYIEKVYEYTNFANLGIS